MFLISKNHPKSKHPLPEWRLSFSFLEREILQNLPEYQRVAVLYIKRKMSGLDAYKSYHVKTVLMELSTQPPVGIENALQFKKVLIERLIKAYKEWNLPNFFVPSQNLFEYETSKSSATEIVNKFNEIKNKPNTSEIRSYNFTFDNKFNREEPVPLLTRLNTLEKETNFPVLDNKNKTTPQNISVMFLTEIYNDLLSNMEKFLLYRSVKYSTDIELSYKPPYTRDKILKIKKFVDYIQTMLLSKITQLKRIVRLVKFQAACSGGIDDEVFEEILQFPVKIYYHYAKLCYDNIPILPTKRTEFEEMCNNRQLYPTDEDFITDLDILRDQVANQMEKVIQEINETSEGQQVNRFYRNLTTLLDNLIIKKNMINLYVPEDKLLGRCPSKLMTDLFDLRNYFTKLDEKILEWKIAQTFYEIWRTHTEFFMQILHTDKDQRQPIKEEAEKKLMIYLNRYVYLSIYIITVGERDAYQHKLHYQQRR